MRWIILPALFGTLAWTAFAADRKSTSPWPQIQGHFAPPAEFLGQFGQYRSPLLFDDGRPVHTPQEWQQRRKEILAYWHGVMGPWPDLLNKPAITIIGTEPREDFSQHRVRVQLDADRSIDGYLLMPRGDGPFPAVVVPFYEPQTSMGVGKSQLRDFGLQLTRRGFVTLCIGSPGGDARKPALGHAVCQPLSYLAWVAATCHNALANHAAVDHTRIGIVGHSYGGKWAMFAACLYDKFACGVWSDPGIVFDERRPNVNYWEPWYLGLDPTSKRKPGVVTPDNPRTGAYRRLVADGRNLHELQALMAPRPFLVSGGAEDGPQRWIPLNHVIAVNRLLGNQNRVGMTNRTTHDPTARSNEVIYLFFEHFLKQEQ